MKRKFRIFAIIIAVVGLLAPCASAKSKKASKSKKDTSSEVDFNAVYAAGDYASCAEILLSDKKEKNVILNNLDANMLQFLSNDYMASGKGFLQTQGMMQQSASDTSGGKGFAAAIAGENSVTYTGTTYERILAYTMRAVNALSMGDVSNAKGLMDTYTGDFKAELSALIAEQRQLDAESEESLEGDSVKDAMGALDKVGISINLDDVNSGKPAKSDKIYEDSAFLAYLGTIAYAANGDSVHAQDFANVLKAFGSGIDVSEDIEVPTGKGRLDVVALSGTIGKRSENAKEFTVMPLIPIANVPLNFKIAYPVFDSSAQNHKIDGVKVTLSNGTQKNAVLVENFDEAVKMDVESKARGAYNRSIYRNIVKNSIGVATSIVSLGAAKKVVDESSGNKIKAMAAAKAYDATLAGVNTALSAVIDAEKADVRQGSYFPHKASAAGFTVEPGTYSVKVEYLSGSSVVDTKEYSNIVVDAGKPTIVCSSCEK